MAHRWCNIPNVKQPNLGRTREGKQDPQAIAAEAAEPWAHKWHTQHPRLHEGALAALAGVRTTQLRRQPANETAKLLEARFNVEAVRQACKSFLVNTSVGTDGWKFREWAALPDEYLAVLTAILAKTVTTLAVPAQTLIPRLSLLANKLGVANDRDMFQLLPPAAQTAGAIAAGMGPRNSRQPTHRRHSSARTRPTTRHSPPSAEDGNRSGARICGHPDAVGFRSLL